MTRATTYGFINAKLRARISRMLPREWFLRLAGMPSLTEAVALLEDTPYASALGVYKQTGDLKMMEAEIERLEYEDVVSVRRYLSEPASGLATALFQKYTVDRVKNAIRLWFARVVAGRPVDHVIAYVSSWSEDDGFSVDAVVNAPDADSLVEQFAQTPFAMVVRETIGEVAERKSLYLLELALDRWYFSQLRTATSQLDRMDAADAHRLLGIRVDLLNLHWITRVKEFYKMSARDVTESLIPGGAVFSPRTIESIYQSTEPAAVIASSLAGRYGGANTVGGETDELRRLTLLSSMLQEVLMHEIHRVLGAYPFTIGIVLAYVFLRQNEARMITTALNARAYELEPGVIGGVY